ncbi:hypothetical protein ACFO4N_18115, partial [Camelliibacillus cellulosilyticus]
DQKVEVSAQYRSLSDLKHGHARIRVIKKNFSDQFSKVSDQKVEVSARHPSFSDLKHGHARIRTVKKFLVTGFSKLVTKKLKLAPGIRVLVT